jgi:FKBP-type peptidyl-prolyl cis-trans isomerase
MKITLFSLLFLLSLGTLNSCGSRDAAPHPIEPSRSEITKTLLEANKAALKEENDQIDRFVLTKGWNVSKTATGLRWQMLANGKGKKVQNGSAVRIDYDVMLLSGETIYSSAQSGPKELVIGSFFSVRATGPA